MADISGNIITLRDKSTALFEMMDASGNTYTNADGYLKIRIIDADNKEIDVLLTSIENSTTFLVSEPLAISTCFVYGQQVNDFNTVDKNAIFTIATSALQEVDRELQDLKNLVNTLIARIVALGG